MDESTQLSLKNLANIGAKFLHTRRVRHNYNNSKYGLNAATILSGWAKDNYKPISIACHGLRITPQTLRLQIQQGLIWNIENAADEKTQAFFDYIQAVICYTIDQSSLVISKRHRLLDSVRVEVDITKLSARADFKTWIAGNPPVKSTWPPSPLPRIEQDDVDFFTEELRKLEELGAGYVAIIRPDNIKFMRHSVAS